MTQSTWNRSNCVMGTMRWIEWNECNWNGQCVAVGEVVATSSLLNCFNVERSDRHRAVGTARSFGEHCVVGSCLKWHCNDKSPWNFSFPGNRILESGDVGIRRVLISTTAFTLRYRHVGHIDISISQDSLATQNLDSKWKRRAPLSPQSLDTVIQHLLSRNMPAPLDAARGIVWHVICRSFHPSREERFAATNSSRNLPTIWRMSTKQNLEIHLQREVL